MKIKTIEIDDKKLTKSLINQLPDLMILQIENVELVFCLGWYLNRTTKRNEKIYIFIIYDKIYRFSDWFNYKLSDTYKDRIISERHYILTDNPNKTLKIYNELKEKAQKTEQLFY